MKLQNSPHVPLYVFAVAQPLGKLLIEYGEIKLSKLNICEILVFIIDVPGIVWTDPGNWQFCIATLDRYIMPFVQ